MSLNSAESLLLLNMKCSKCRAIKAWFEEKGIAAEERHYLDDPLDVEELRELHALLGLPIREWMRSSESAYAESGLSAASTDEELLAAIAAHPILLQRPIYIRAGKAAVGRPLENITALV